MQNGTKTIEALIADLDHPDKSVIRSAVDALIPLASASEATKARLVQRLTHSQSGQRWPIAYVLAHRPRISELVLQALFDALDSRDSEIRWAIALLLIRLGKTDTVIVTRLLELCAHGTATQRKMAVYCIRDLELADGRSLESLLNALNDPEPMVRVAAVTSLKARSDVDDNGRRALLNLFLNDPDVRVRNVAAITLAVLGSPSEKFLSALHNATEADNAQIKKAAFAALSLLHNKSKRSAPSGG